MKSWLSKSRHRHVSLEIRISSKINTAALIEIIESDGIVS